MSSSHFNTDKVAKRLELTAGFNRIVHFLNMKYFIAIPVALIGIILLATSITVVDIGEKVLVVGFGQIKGELDAGMHFVNPFYTTYDFTVRNNKYETTASSASNDLQTAVISVAVNYNIDETKISDIYSKYGKDYTSRIFTQNVQEAVKSISAKYSASELITKREAVKSDMKAKLQEMVADSIIVTDVAVTNIDFSDSFNAAIEAKVVADQQAQEAKSQLEKKKFEAEAIKVQAEAINNSGGAEYVQLKAIEKWDGVLPTTNGAVVPFLNIK